jgi:hypothetical protein
MSALRDPSDEDDDRRESLDDERMLRSIQRIRMLPPALLILGAALIVIAIIYWLVCR